MSIIINYVKNETIRDNKIQIILTLNENRSIIV